MTTIQEFDIQMQRTGQHYFAINALQRASGW